MNRFFNCTLFGLFLFLVSCAPVRINELKSSEIRRATWFEYYYRGIFRASNKNWNGGIEDFDVATGERSGAIFPVTEDTRWVRTYGLHYVRNYFPHREKGICLFHLGNYEEAESELKRSIYKGYKSARAIEYLNKTTKKLYSEKAKASSPNFQFKIHNPRILNSPVLPLSGSMIKNSGFITKVSVNSTIMPIDIISNEFSFTTSFIMGPNSSGVQNITITAWDLIGRSKPFHMQVYVDLENPEILILRKVQTDDGFIYHGEVKDDFSLDSIWLDDKKIKSALKKGILEGCENNNKAWDFELEVKNGDSKSLRVFDMVGNKSVMELPGLKNLNGLEQNYFYHRKESRTIKLAYDGPRLSDFITKDREISNRVKSLETDKGRNRQDLLEKNEKKNGRKRNYSEVFFDYVDPIIVLDPELKELPSVNPIVEDLFISNLTVMDDSPIKLIQVTRNGKPIARECSNCLGYTGPLHFKLEKTENDLAIVAQDSSENENIAERNFILRKVSSLERSGFASPLVLLYYDHKSRKIGEERNVLKKLESRLIKKFPSRFKSQLVQTEKALLHKTQERRIKKKYRGNLFFVLEVSTNPEGFDIFPKIIFPGFAQMKKVHDITWKGEVEELGLRLEELAMELVSPLPSGEAFITEPPTENLASQELGVDNGLFVPMGENYKIYPGCQFFFFSPSELDKSKPRPIMTKGGRIARGKAVQVGLDYCYIKLSRNSKDLVNVGDLAVVR